MSLADRLAEQPHVSRNDRCSIGRLREELNEEDRTTLDAALTDQNINGSTIFKALRAEGHRVGDSSVRRHRRGACNCVSQ